MKWLADLNPEQRQAVEAGDGPLIIVAGPGTGKTKTLTARIAHLIASGKAKPEEIVALTFTRKAAAEMQQRVAALLGNHTLPKIATFHSLCNDLLAAENGTAPVFITDHERLLLIKELRKAQELKTLTTRELALAISRMKNLPPDQQQRDPALARLLLTYNQALHDQDLRDYDDLLLQTHDLLVSHPRAGQFAHILVDEFQDTNALQYEILRLLQSNDNLCVIGDPAQSIYGFRGASDAMFDRFAADFPVAQRITLTTNYRSTPEVVRVANAVFPDAPALIAHRTETGSAQAVEVLNEYSEAEWIVNQIEQAVGGTDFLRSHSQDYAQQHRQSFRGWAVLYRTHYVSQTARRAFAGSGIPYQVVGEGSPYEEPAVWAVMQLLCYLADPGDEQRKAVGALSALKNFSDAQITKILEALREQPQDSLLSLAATVADSFGLPQEKLTQLNNTLIRFEQQGLSAFAHFVAGLSDANFYDPKADAVALMTIHAAKGLEFPHVFLIAAEEGVLPHKRPGEDQNLAEERRLFYVAVTRARESLSILHTKTRGKIASERSRFIEGLPLEFVQDEAMADQARRQQKRQAKRRQATLFDL